MSKSKLGKEEVDLSCVEPLLPTTLYSASSKDATEFSLSGVKGQLKVELLLNSGPTSKGDQIFLKLLG